MKNRKGYFLPFVTTEGLKASINTNEIPKDKWTVHHGQAADGTQVNSLKTQPLGKSVLIQNEAGAILSVTAAEFQVAAEGFLTKSGYTVEAPTRS